MTEYCKTRGSNLFIPPRTTTAPLSLSLSLSLSRFELLVDYVVPRNQPVSHSRDVSLANTARKKRNEQERKSGREGVRSGEARREREPNARHRQRDERDERVGELIRRQECRPETPAGLYSFPDTVPGKPDGPEPRETNLRASLNRSQLRIPSF